MRILCIQHVPFEGPGAIAHWAERRGHHLNLVHLYAGDPLPAQDTFDRLLILGGPMGVGEEARYPWMPREKRFLRETIAAGCPIVGICLGAQLLAEALGGAVYRGERREIGWFPIRFTQTARTHPLFSSLPETLEVFHWHGETFQLPPGASLIASSACYPNQAFLFQDRILGLQFHLEVTPANLDALIREAGDELAEGGPTVQSPERMRGVPPQTFARIQEALFQILDALPSTRKT